MSGGQESSGAADVAGASPSALGGATPAFGTNTILARAYAELISNLQVEGEGIVVRILPDDDEGIRHQRFIVRLATGQTLLIAHNIDLAPRVADLREGDSVTFSGEYEWTEEGGTVHWTHRDPGGEHASGWIMHGGRLYQ